MYLHQAPKQMLGYIYQMRYALYLLLKDDNPQSQVAIEKLDDISITTDTGHQTNFQLKHHDLQTGDLTNASTDLWKTLYIWIKLVENKKELLNTTKFIIITTAKVPSNSAASFLGFNESKRNESKAKEILQQVACSSENKNHKSYYVAFTKCESALLDCLLTKIYILAEEPSAADIKLQLMNVLKYGTTPRYQERILERLEGWWEQQVISALSQTDYFLPNQNEVRGFIARIRDEYTENNLPIDVGPVQDLDEFALEKEERIFIEQLRLVGIGSHRIRLAIQDYYRAFAQRGNWMREGLLFPDELGNYESRLVEEWKHLFYELLDEASLMDIDERVKQTKGKDLFNKVEQFDIRIRPNCRDPFIMRGSYHQLANQLRVGWHIEFEDRLKKILTHLKENV